MKKLNHFLTAIHSFAASAKRAKNKSHAIGLAIVAGADPASAQLTKASSFITSIQTWLQGIGISIIIIAIIWGGVEIIFGKKKITDMAHIFWGGFLIGGASIVASWLATGIAQ